MDQYLVCGEDYKTIRNAVAKEVMEGKVDGLEETCEVMLHHFLGFCFHMHVYMDILFLFGCVFIRVQTLSTMENTLSSVGTVQSNHHSLQRSQW